MARRIEKRQRPAGKRGLKLDVLFTCVGRRVELVQRFRKAAANLGIRLRIHGCDANQLSPALFHVDKAHHLPRIARRNYISELKALVGKNKIDLLIPLIDTELSSLAQARESIEETGCRVLISSHEVISITRDKLKTYEALSEANIDTPQTWTWEDVIQKKRHKFPYFLKPRTGSAGLGNYIVRNRDELQTFGSLVQNAIVQEYVVGDEHTLDVYTGIDGKPRCIVPRKRLETRTGEVSKGVVVKDSAIMAVGERVTEAIGPCRGVITIQCIVTPKRQIRVIEINPRFGGGVPLAIEAGADFPKWLLMETLGKTPRIRQDGFRDGVTMLRYDQAVFISEKGKPIVTK